MIKPLHRNIVHLKYLDETNLGKKRFMMAFNRLPSNRRTTRVAALRTEASIANSGNFINVDETVKAKSK